MAGRRKNTRAKELEWDGVTRSVTKKEGRKTIVEMRQRVSSRVWRLGFVVSALCFARSSGDFPGVSKRVVGLSSPRGGSWGPDP
jgi:hypothetical protein